MHKKQILWLAVLIQATISGFAQSTATINWTNVHQQIDGFGASFDLEGQTLTSGQQALFLGTGAGQLGLSIDRVPVPNGAEFPGSCASVSASCAGSGIGTMISDMQAVVAAGGSIYASNVGLPPAYIVSASGPCPPSGYGVNPVTGTLNPSDYGAYAQWQLNFAESVKAQIGVYPKGISLQNEPDQCDDGILWSPSYIDTFVKNNWGPTFNSNSIPTLIFIPEAGNYNPDLSALGGTCGTDSSCSQYASFNLHDYDAQLSGTNTVTPDPLPGGWPAHRYWETEASCTGSFPSFCTSDSSGDITNALYWGAVVDQRMQDNMNAWLWWEATYTGVASYSLLDSTNTTVLKRGYMLGQYSKFVRPGYYRIDATHNPQSGVSVSAYQQTSSNTLVIIATNYTGSSLSQTFNITNAPTFSTLAPTITSASQNLAQLSNVSLSGNSFTYTLPAQSIMTFVGSTASIPPPTNLSGTVVQ
jgi:glucuronoarabinoxylan endo-1,4-beta-xylanase